MAVAQRRHRQARLRWASGSDARADASIVTPVHQHGASKSPDAAGTHLFGAPQTGHTIFGRASTITRLSDVAKERASRSRQLRMQSQRLRTTNAKVTSSRVVLRRQTCKFIALNAVDRGEGEATHAGTFAVSDDLGITFNERNQEGLNECHNKYPAHDGHGPEQQRFGTKGRESAEKRRDCREDSQRMCRYRLPARLTTDHSAGAEPGLAAKAHRSTTAVRTIERAARRHHGSVNRRGWRRRTVFGRL